MTATTNDQLPRRPRSGADRYREAIAAGLTPGDALAKVVVDLSGVCVTPTALTWAVMSAVTAHRHRTATAKD